MNAVFLACADPTVKGTRMTRSSAALASLVSAALLAACAYAPGGADAVATPEGPNSDVARAISETLRAHHFDPASLDDPAYVAIEAEVAALGAQDLSTEDFIAAFNDLWRDGPFSHVRLTQSNADAASTAAYLDNLRIGGGGARLAWDGDVAVLTVSTMMGQDTIEEIDAAYAEIDRRGTRALVIDLRENEGGAFAVRPLVGHLMSRPYDAGVFVSQPWNARMHRGPAADDAADVAPWEGWSLTAFWNDVERNALTLVRFSPEEPLFNGPVFVLTSTRTASAAEMATHALKASGRATVIGENTAGEMLSQKPFNLPGDLLLFLPIADYYALDGGRIEGRGVAPDVETAADDAMAAALSLAHGG